MTRPFTDPSKPVHGYEVVQPWTLWMFIYCPFWVMFLLDGPGLVNVLGGIGSVAAMWAMLHVWVGPNRGPSPGAGPPWRGVRPLV